MACAITSGRLDFSCKTIIGGLKSIYVLAFDAANFTVTGGAATLVGTPSYFEFELLNDGNTFEESNEVSKDAGTSIFSQTGTFVLKGQDAASQVALSELSKTRTQVIVEDNMGNMRVAGVEFGTDFTVGTTSGGSLGEMSGYNVSFSSSATELAPFLSSFGTAVAGSTIDPN